MNTQIQPLEIPLKGTATQIFIRTSTVSVVLNYFNCVTNKHK